MEDLLGDDPPEVSDVGDLLEVLTDAVQDLATGFAQRVPLFVLGLLVLLAALLATRLTIRLVERGMRRARLDHTVERLVSNLLRVSLVTAAILLGLSVAGISVGALLAGVGLAGLALAFALQNILENFVAGLLILIRRPFRRGDQIVTNEFSGTVQDIDLRVTRLKVFDGEEVLIPNATVFTEPITNLTRLGSRRTQVIIGIDYRDDHHAVQALLLEALRTVPGILDAPEPEVLLIELAESSVDFEISYWTDPDIRTVRHVRHRVLTTCKSAIEDAGMTIPWPIRTLAADKDALQVRAGQPLLAGEPQVADQPHAAE
jgi:small conductance mechanosensitive channel